MKTACTEELFLKDVSEHYMTILRDDGLFRHVAFKRPGTTCYRFDLITWPGFLCYCGDMGTYVFSRIADMFEFFRTRPDGKKGLHINAGYWAEKCQAQDRHAPIQEYSADKFMEQVKDWLGRREGITPELRQAVEDEVLSHADDGEYAAMHATMEFEHDGELLFQDFWECNLKEYTFRYLWCCYALAWGIEQYDRVKTAGMPPNNQG